MAFEGVIDFFTEDGKILKREINKTVSNSRKFYNHIQTQLLQNVSLHLNGICQGMLEKTSDRAKVYLGELKNEVLALDIPLNEYEKQNHFQFIQELDNMEQAIHSNYNHLKDYTDGIDAIKVSKSLSSE